MGSFFQTVTDLEVGLEILRDRTYGVIEVCDQEFQAVHLRPYPKLVSIAEVRWSNFWKKRSEVQAQADRILLYYNQPVLHRNFLALKYFVSDYKSTLASIAISLSVLDFIAKVKQTDAIVTEITNDRIKDRHLAHFGWEEHLQQRRGRHWIKRFYGSYPTAFLFQEIQRSESEAQSELSVTPVPAYNMPVVVSPLSNCEPVDSA